MNTERQLQIEKCGEILYGALNEIRMLSHQEGNFKRINDLSALVHNLPRFMTGQDDYAIEGLRESLMDYARKYSGGGPVDRYLRIWDMDEASFSKVFRMPQGGWPQPTEELLATAS